MEYVNKVEIVGQVGNSRITDVADKKQYRFSVMTDRVYDGAERPVIETTWHSVSFFREDDTLVLTKGCWVRVTGRLRLVQYIDEHGERRSITDIVANEVTPLNSK